MSYAEQLKRDGHLLNRPPRPPKKRLPLKRTRISPISKKREGANREYLKKRRAFLRAHPYCMAWPTIWAYHGPKHVQKHPLLRSTDIHHIKGRVGSNFLDESTWLAVSRIAHNWIHNHPKEARSLGLLA